jgi:hypothetical protein
MQSHKLKTALQPQRHKPDGQQESPPKQNFEIKTKYEFLPFSSPTMIEVTDTGKRREMRGGQG